MNRFVTAFSLGVTLSLFHRIPDKAIGVACLAGACLCTAAAWLIPLLPADNEDKGAST